MTAFIHPYHHMAGDFPCGSPLHTTDPYSYPEYLVPSSPYPYTAASSMTQNPMVGQPLPTQAADATFFEEAFVASPVPTDIGFGFIQTPVPRYTGAPVILESQDMPQNTLSIARTNPKPTRQARNRRQSQVSTAMTEASSAGIHVKQPEHKKRGRKPKVEPKDEDMWRLREKSEDENPPRDPRRRRVLERNRIAATKCRLRKRDEASALASREQTMEDQNRYLSSCFDALTTEIYHLKTQLLRHTDCNCTLIQRYITNEAKKSVDGLTSCTSAFHRDMDSMSPYQQGTSNSGTSPSDSFQATSPESEVVHSSWPNPFQQAATLSDAGEKMFEMPMEPFHEGTIALTPGQHMSGVAPMHGHGPEMYAHMGHHPQQISNVWDWECQ